MEQPLVSVIVPVYNAGEHIARCIESIRRQSYQNLEIIIVNDGSKDVSLHVCEMYARVDKRILPALQQLFDAARAEGLYPVVASGWRTGEEQRQIMEDKVEAYRREGYPELLARQAAAQWVAQPGTSEHELGLAVDINPDQTMGTGQELYDWLLEHAWEYGFIKRYPADKVDITGISNEPWHYRYVGQDAARAITEQGLCLEEYLGQA